MIGDPMRGFRLSMTHFAEAYSVLVSLNTQDYADLFAFFDKVEHEADTPEMRDSVEANRKLLIALQPLSDLARTASHEMGRHMETRTR